MSSRFTLDTNILKIRDVFAYKADTGEPIESSYFPVYDEKLKWQPPFDFLKSISIPTLNTSVNELLYAIQPGLSTLSTNFTEEFDIALKSTVGGLGQIYVSSSKLHTTFVNLSYEHGYISSTALYDCIKSLGKLDYITDHVGPMVISLSGAGIDFLPYGYVSTVHPGKYKQYYSTLGIAGANLTNTTLNNNITNEGIRIDIGGYLNTLLDSSKLRIDITGNINVTYPSYPTPIVTTFSTFLYNGTSPIGTPVVVNYSNAIFNMSKLTYFLDKSELTPFPSVLSLRHRITNVNNTAASITTSIPNIGGIHIHLNNMD
jgi:hypothetical protein